MGAWKLILIHGRAVGSMFHIKIGCAWFIKASLFVDGTLSFAV